jgi:methylase of polypeptide subunit release factors
LGSRPSALIRKALQNLAYRVFRSRFVAQLLFRIKFRPVPEDYYYFDTTTYVTTRRASKSLGRTNTVVDMGTGSAAAVGLFLWKQIGCSVISVDINPTMVEMSAASIRLNGAPVTVIQSDLFENVHEPFDTVIFNPPYVHTDSGLARKLTQATRSQWDGGPAGTDVIERFADAIAALPHPVVTYMGINAWHVTRDTVLDILSRRPAIVVDEVFHHRILPVYVYIFRNARRDAASARRG